MTAEQLWQIDTDEFARAVESIENLVPFDLDETVHTWQCSYFRFVRASLAAFPTLIRFAAMAISTTATPNIPILDWARTVVFSPIFPERQMAMIEAARNDCTLSDSECKSIPNGLTFDGDVIDAFELCDRSGHLCDLDQHDIYRTAGSYYLICLNHES